MRGCESFKRSGISTVVKRNEALVTGHTRQNSVRGSQERGSLHRLAGGNKLAFPPVLAGEKLLKISC